jgi:hypothetical protein
MISVGQLKKRVRRSHPVILRVQAGRRHRPDGEGHRGKRLFYNAPIAPIPLSSFPTKFWRP